MSPTVNWRRPEDHAETERWERDKADPPSPAQRPTGQEVDEERWRHDSITLNTIGWRMAVALGRVPDGASAVAGNPEEQLSALLADLDAAREALRRVEEERDTATSYAEFTAAAADALLAGRDRMQPVIEAVGRWVDSSAVDSDVVIDAYEAYERAAAYETQEGTDVA